MAGSVCAGVCVAEGVGLVVGCGLSAVAGTVWTGVGVDGGDGLVVGVSGGEGLVVGVLGGAGLVVGASVGAGLVWGWSWAKVAAARSRKKARKVGEKRVSQRGRVGDVASQTGGWRLVRRPGIHPAPPKVEA